jgi:hypothetical protein
VSVVTATQITTFTDISATTPEAITASGLIPIVQDRIVTICNRAFGTGLERQTTVTFNATAGTITSSSSDWAGDGFAAGDEIWVSNSYRNNGFYNVSSITGSVLTVLSTESVVDELSGRSVYFTVVDWPDELAYVAAWMVKFDYDDRKSRTAGVTARSLGPFSESYSDVGLTYGYPPEIIEQLNHYRVVDMG